MSCHFTPIAATVADGSGEHHLPCRGARWLTLTSFRQYRSGAIFPFSKVCNAISARWGRRLRQSRRLVPIAWMRPLARSGLVNSLNSSLPPIDDRLCFCPAHEDTAEAARSRIAEAQGDLRYALVGFKKQVARRIEAHFRNHLTIAGAHSSEMTLQRARAHPQLDCCAFKCCAAVTQ